MMTLKKYSTRELQAELARRKDEIRHSLPRPLENPNWADVIKMSEAVLSFAAEKSRLDTDDEHELAQAVLEIVYGQNIWDWLRIIEGKS